MSKLLRISLAELLLVCFIFGSVLPPSIHAEESEQQIPTEVIIEATLDTPVSDDPSSDIANTGLLASGDPTLDTTGSGTNEGSVIIDSSDRESTTVSTDSVTHSGDTMIVDPDPLVNNSGSVVIQDTTQSGAVETIIDREKNPVKISNPTEEILVQFHTDIEGYLGGYQVEQVATLNNLTTEELILENNIAVMSVEEDIATPFVSNNKTDSVIAQLSDDTVETKIDETIDLLKQDPRVAHVQRNFVYTIASYNPQTIWTNTSTGVTTSTGVVTSFQIITPSSVTVNQPFDVTIRPKDANGLTVTNYTGSFIFISDYFGDIVPSPGQAIVFSGANGEMTFPLGMQMNNLGQNSIFVADVNNSQDVTGTTTVYVQSELPISVNDPDFSKLWGLHNEGQSVNGDTGGTPDADIDYPEAIAYASGKLGTGVIVAVLDSGIAYNHPDLVGHMWDGSNCLSDTGAYIGGCTHGYDFANNDKIPNEMYSHGTHVAGTIGAIVNNGTGIVGVSPNLQLMAVKILGDDGLGSTADIIRGINFARYNGAKVINGSFGRHYMVGKKSDFDFLTYQAIQDFPGLFVAAAGNSGVNMNDSYRAYPAGFGTDTVVSGEGIIPGLQNIISVAASDRKDNLANFSNYGTGTVHIAAPGTSIYSTYRTVPFDADYMTDGWIRTGGSHSGIFLMSGSLESGGYLMMDDMRMSISGEPVHTSGEVAYIEKTFSSSGMKLVHSAFIRIWCDTPITGTWKDYISIGHDTGDGYIENKKIDEDSLWSESWGTGTVFDGREGAHAYVNINPFDIPNSTFKIRLGWHTDDIEDVDPFTGKYYGGCRITDGLYIRLSDNGESGGYEFADGTSMAAPHVAGAVALAMSYAPNASISDIRNAILWSSDYKSQLADKVMYGRLNVANMLKALTQPNLIKQKVTLSGESVAVIDYQSDIPTTGYVFYSTGQSVESELGGTEFASSIFTGTMQNHRSILSGLIPDTTYYYRVQVSNEYQMYINPDYFEKVYSFRTPKVIPQTATGGVISGTGMYYLSGSSASGVTYGTGGTQKLILSDSGNTATLDLSLTGVTLIASGSWDGIFVAPTVVATNTSITLVGGTTISSEAVYEIGSPTTSLTLSGKTATISIKTTSTSGTVYRVYRSDDGGNTFNDVGSCTVRGGECSFATDHFSQFALGNPVYQPTPSTNQPVSGAGGGGGGGGSVGGTNPYNTSSLLGGKLLLESIGLYKHDPSIKDRKIPKKLHEITIFLSAELVKWDRGINESIIETLHKSLQSSSQSVLTQLIMYDRILTSLDRMLKQYPSPRSKQYKTLISVKKYIRNERLSFIKQVLAKDPM